MCAICFLENASMMKNLVEGGDIKRVNVVVMAAGD